MKIFEFQYDYFDIYLTDYHVINYNNIINLLSNRLCYVKQLMHKSINDNKQNLFILKLQEIVNKHNKDLSNKEYLNEYKKIKMIFEDNIDDFEYFINVKEDIGYRTYQHIFQNTALNINQVINRMFRVIETYYVN